MQLQFNTPKRVLTAAMLLLPVAAQAHHAESMSDRPLIQGLSMPLHGVDHLLSAIVIGILAGKIGGNKQWRLPALFSLLSIIGGLLNLSGVTLPELCVPATAALMVSSLWMRVPTMGVLALMAALAGVCNGQALLQNPPSGLSSALFVLGCLASSLGFCYLGILIGRSLQTRPRIAQLTGTGLLAGIIYLCAFPSFNEAVIRLLE